MNRNNTIIVGGGWAGLAAGVELSSRGVPVTLFESAGQLGGRARSIRFGDQNVDNGQHLLIGGYRETLRLLKLCGTHETERYFRMPLLLSVLGENEQVTIRTPHLPAPLHIITGLLLASGLNLRQKSSALRFSTHLVLSGFLLNEDCSVADLLKRHNQDEFVVKHLWQPLCLGALNTPVEEASAQIFLRVLKVSFAKRRKDSDMLIPKTDLGHCFPEAARKYIEQHGGKVIMNSRVTGITLNHGNVTGVTVDGENIHAEHVILATPPWTTRDLLRPHREFSEITSQLDQMAFNPITTVYLRYQQSTTLPQPMIGLSGGLGQWIFDRSICDQHGLMAVVISGSGPHMVLDNQQLIDEISSELSNHFPHWPAPENSLVIREKRATFSCHTGVSRLRPPSRTSVAGCLLAGDYTNTGYPATLEGAVVSGVQCADVINQQS